MNEFFIAGFEKVAINAKTIRKAYVKALSESSDLKKLNPAPLDKIKKRDAQATFFGKGLDKKMSGFVAKGKAKSKAVAKNRADSAAKVKGLRGSGAGFQAKKLKDVKAS